MQTNTNTQLALFQMISPSLPEGIGQKPKINDKGRVTSIRVTLENRKAIAARLGIENNKENADTITAELLKMTDAVRNNGFAEIAKLALSPNWTGAGFSVSVNKKGKQKATFSMQSVDRLGLKATPEQCEKAIASMTAAQVKTMLERGAALKKSLEAAVELETLEDAGDAPNAQ